MQKSFAEIAIAALVIAGGISGCDSISIGDILPPATQEPAPAPVSKSSNAYSALEQSAHQQVNQYRASLNLPPLKLDPRISEVAREHSKAMASDRATFSHDGFEQRANKVNKAIVYRSFAENLAFNQGYKDPVRQAVQGWIKSPGHRQNMEGKFDMTGIGVAKNADGEYYFTQLFVRRLW